MGNVWSKGRHRVVVHVTGWDVERFLNICKHNELELMDIIKDKTGVFITVSYRQWKELKKYEEKCQVKCSLVMEKGLVPFLLTYKKRVVFAISLLLFCLLIWYSSLFIWHIEVEGESLYTEEEIVEYIQTALVPFGSRRADVSLSELEKQLRIQFHQVAWITCEIDGTRLIVRIVETVEQDKIPSCTQPCNIVAIKDAYVTDLIATSGQKLVSPGDEVKKGDILITGVVNIYNEYEELIETNYVSASGVVYGKTEYLYVQTVAMEYTEKKQGKKKRAIAVRVGQELKYLYKPKNTEGLERVEALHTLHVGDSYYLPFSFLVTTYYEPVYETKIYTKEEAEEKQKKLLWEYMENRKKKGVEILENNVTIEFKDDVCVASGTIVVKEMIGVPETFTALEPIAENEE